MTENLISVSTNNTSAHKEDSALLKRDEAQDPSHAHMLRFVILCVITACVLVVSVCLGRLPVSLGELASIISAAAAQQIDALLQSIELLFGSAVQLPRLDASGQYFEGIDQSATAAVLNVRLPRVVVCAFVGAALSVAGAAYQGLFQNPMVSQDVLGASSGAAFGAALGIFLAVGAQGVSVMAFVFGMVAVGISYSISRVGRANPILSLILAGMVVSALFSSGTSVIKLVADTEDTLPAITYWLMGSLASIRVDDVAPTIVLVVVAMLPIYLLRWRINLLATGEEEAKSLGMNTNAMRLGIIACATFLTATCVSVSGLIGWVGLVIPHFCRMMFGYDYRRVIPACIVMGAGFLVLVDDIARLATTSEIPIGILTSFVGAPIFIYLIARGGGRNGAQS